jgi:hypothetical protein
MAAQEHTTKNIRMNVAAHVLCFLKAGSAESQTLTTDACLITLVAVDGK